MRMVRKHVYRVNAVGGHTSAASSSLMPSAWLPLLEEQLKLIDFGGLSFPVYYQYPLGTALVLSRYEENPVAGWGAARQLVFDDMADADELFRVRPVSPERLWPSGEAAGIIDEIEAESLADSPAADECFRALDRIFAGDENMLACLIGAASLCARDKRLTLRAALSGGAEQISEDGRRIAELLNLSLSREDALRLSICTWLRPGGEGMRFSVGFCADDGQAYGDTSQEIFLNLARRAVYLPMGVTIPENPQDREAARALLAHDLVRLGRARSSVNPVRSDRETVRAEAASFEKGMSLAAYFSEWRKALLAKRELLTEDGFRALASAEWKKLLNAVVAASELMDNMEFLAELNGILSLIRREKLEDQLALDGETTTDLIVLLLDSIQWRQVDLAQPKACRLIRSVTAYSQILDVTQCDPACLAACRIVYRLLTAPAFVHESLDDMAFLEERASAQFAALQDCLKQYVQNRMTADIDVIDEAFAAAAMLAFARFSDGVPDLRLADKMAEHLEMKKGAKAARRFQTMMDKLRRNLRSKRAGTFRLKDLKLLIFISCLLVLLIAGITISFLLMN